MRSGHDRILAAIDVGTNAVRLEIARVLSDGSLETLHQERDPVRPGEGVFASGVLARPVADRLLGTLRRYAVLCLRYRARVRAVATSAVREARNRDAVVRRVRDEAGLTLEVVSGREEARLICLGVLAGRPPTSRALVVDIGGGSTEIAPAVGEKPTALFSVGLGAVRLTEIFASSGRVSRERLAVMRSFAAEAFRDSLPADLPRFRHALGSSGTINAIVAAHGDGRRLTLRALDRAVAGMADMSLAERRRRFEPKRAEIVVAGAVILETAMRHLRLERIVSVDTGLRDGILRDLARRSPGAAAAAAADRTEAVLALGRRFGFDEAHARQVARLALALFDQLAGVHALAASARGLLEAAALLHDLGHAVSPNRHHKHTYYLVVNADIPGFSDEERRLVALVARYHRRSPPERHREDLEDLSPGDFRTVRRLVALLRIADALDRSHHQPVVELRAAAARRAVRVAVRSRGAVDLELWDVAREARLFRAALGRRVEVVARRGGITGSR
ncbi:Ppx/GppA phosphatase family protein [Anaeromyxobacter oryzisoli]|uniref:Ppx/GppA phosphatase family protein n=1 Tax=Anaeromyxobacter oryzisoli TaxID=2925408 RepID=UPI001F593E18|nr:Ppx/GppA phosphatase family protein [Anaeromyxobacter sp. SG63]